LTQYIHWAPCERPFHRFHTTVLNHYVITQYLVLLPPRPS
jgi:hypothetical protein